MGFGNGEAGRAWMHDAATMNEKQAPDSTASHEGCRQLPEALVEWVGQSGWSLAGVGAHAG